MEKVRATPIEYSYIDGYLYFLSEGGEKFSHLLINPYVSVEVNDNYAGFDNINGLQITGNVQIIPFESSEYKRISILKGLNSESLAKLPFQLNMLKVIPVRFKYFLLK